MRAKAFVGKLERGGDNYLQLIRDGLTFIDFRSLIPQRPKIFIKPNLTFPTYKPGVMTSPAALAAAIIALQEYGASIWVGDSDSGGYNPFRMEDVYESTGIARLGELRDVQVINLSKVPRTTIQITAGGRDICLEMPRILVEEIDLLVTMPVPKIHANTGVSLTFKNQWGCIPEPTTRLRLHPNFSEVVVAINQAVKARVAIIDGRFGLNRNGPMRGDPVELNWLCVTDDIGAGARIACELMRVPLDTVRHLRYASERGLIPAREETQTNQDIADFVGPKFYLARAWTDWPGYFAFHSRRLAELAYFSRWSDFLHRILYAFREPFYDYHRAK